MNEKVKHYLFRGLFVVAAAGFVAWFVLDQFSATQPTVADPATGHVIFHSFKNSGHIFLTPSEDAPYEWIKLCWFLCAVSGLIVLALDSFMKKWHDKK